MPHPCPKCVFSMTRILILAVATLSWTLPARGAEQAFLVTGEVVASTFEALPVGTPFTGTYSFDDALADTEPSADIGIFATGEYFVDFGPAIGQITFDQSGSVAVRNDEPISFGLQDRFVVDAEVGARATPGFSNVIQASDLTFSDAEFLGLIPAALSGDDLTAVPHVVGAPWDEQGISLQVSAAPSGCVGLATSCTVNLGILTLDPAFELAVSKAGAGSGTVVSDPAGIDCGATCTATLGGTVELTATPDAGSVFVGWSGCDSVAAEVCTVTLASDRAVTATFETAPDIDANPAMVDFGSVELGDSDSRTITVSNLGGSDLAIASVGGLAPPFSILADTCSGATLAPTEACVVDVGFAPTSSGDASDELEIVSDDPDEAPLLVAVAGAGAAPSVLEVPTLGDWALLLLALALAFVGWIAIRR